MESEERTAYISEKFAAYFGGQPEFWSRAPGRVDLMGSHTDYNLGYVMTMTISQDTWIAARPRADRQVRIRSLNLEGESRFHLDEIKHDQRVFWSNYVRGMAYVIQQAGYGLQGFDGLIHSTVPFGSGLSSSAAIEMATAVTCQQVGNFTLDPVEMARLGQRAENDFVGVSTGILDQFSSALGKAGCALQLDCRDLSYQTSQIAPTLHVVICDTRANRSLVGSEYDDRRQQCAAGVSLLQKAHPEVRALRDVSRDQFLAHEAEMPAVIARRCRFIIEENQRVLDLALPLSTGDANALKQLFTDSYRGARDLFEIGSPVMETMMQAMLAGPGIVAARQAGAGFGGCMVALVEKNCVEAFTHHVSLTYKRSANIEPRIFEVVASPGAGPLQM